MVAADPVGLDLVASLRGPAKRDRVELFQRSVLAKRLEMLKEFVPGLARVAVLRNPASRPMPPSGKRRTRLRKLGLALQALDVREPNDFEAAFAAAVQGNAQALVALDDGLTIAYRTRIVALAAGSRLPAIYGLREFPDDGGLVSYGQASSTCFGAPPPTWTRF